MTRLVSFRVTDDEYADLASRAGGGTLSNVVRVALGLTASGRGRPKGSRRNQARDAEIVKRLLEDPYLRESELATEYGVTRQRLNQILKKAGIVRPKAVNRALQCSRCRRMFPREELSSHHASVHARRPAVHGSLTKYRAGCHCELCRAANRSYMASIKGKTPPTHGESGYKNYGCRCDVCRAAGSEQNRRYRLARMARAA